MRAFLVLATMTMGSLFTDSGLNALDFRKGDRTVDQMTCSQAQGYATQHGYYWKNSGGNVLPIYPIVSLEQLRCGIQENAAPAWERTLDQKHCILTWYCRSNRFQD